MCCLPIELGLLGCLVWLCFADLVVVVVVFVLLWLLGCCGFATPLCLWCMLWCGLVWQVLGVIVGWLACWLMRLFGLVVVLNWSVVVSSGGFGWFGVSLGVLVVGIAMVFGT